LSLHQQEKHRTKIVIIGVLRRADWYTVTDLWDECAFSIFSSLQSEQMEASCSLKMSVIFCQVNFEVSAEEVQLTDLFSYNSS
jgi:hypothetical protein